MPTEPDEFDGSKTQPIPGLADEALEVLKQQAENDRRAADLKTWELELKAEDIRIREEIRKELDVIATIFREFQYELAREQDHILSSLETLKDAIVLILTRYINGRRGHGNLEQIKEELRIRQENLNKLKITAAKKGEIDLALSNQIEQEQEEVNRLEAQLIIISLGGK